MKKHYHWIIAVIVAIEMTFLGGLLNSYSVYTIPISETLGVSRAAYASASLPYYILTFLSTILCGFSFRRFGVKRIGMIGLTVCASSLILLSFCKTLTEYTVYRILFATGYGGCYTAASVWIIKAWFHKHQGLMISLISMCTGFGGSLMTSLQSELVVILGWRTSLKVVAMIFIPVLLLFLFIKNDPKEMDLQSYGENQHLKQPHPSQKEWHGYSLNILAKQPMLYIACINILLASVCSWTTPVIVPYLLDSGYSHTAASAYLSIMMITLAFAKPIIGLLSDRFSCKPFAIVCIIFTLIGQLLMMNVSNTTRTAIAMFFLGVGGCSLTIIPPLLSCSLFGYYGSTQANSILIAIPSLSSMIVEPLNNAVYDATGNYNNLFPYLIAVGIFLVTSYLFMYYLADKNRKRYELKRQHSS